MTGPAAAPAAPSDHERKRREILRGAAEVFARRGFAAGTTKEIAGVVGLGQPTIYHYVGAKSDLLVEIAREVERLMLGALDDAAGETVPALRLTRLVEHLTAAIGADPAIFTVYWGELRSLPDDVRAELRAGERRFVDTVTTWVAEAQAEGALVVHGPPFVVAEALLGMVSWLHRWIGRPDGPDPAIVAATFVELVGLPATDTLTERRPAGSGG